MVRVVSCAATMLPRRDGRCRAARPLRSSLSHTILPTASISKSPPGKATAALSTYRPNAPASHECHTRLLYIFDMAPRYAVLRNCCMQLEHNFFSRE